MIQLASPAVWGCADPVGSIEDRPQLVGCVEVRPVVDLPAGDPGRDHVGLDPLRRDVFGQLPHRRDPPHLPVDVFGGPGLRPGHRHLAAHCCLAGKPLGAHGVEHGQVPAGFDVGQAEGVFDLQQGCDVRRQAAFSTGHGDTGRGAIPVKSRQHARMCRSSADR